MASTATADIFPRLVEDEDGFSVIYSAVEDDAVGFDHDLDAAAGALVKFLKRHAASLSALSLAEDTLLDLFNDATSILSSLPAGHHDEDEQDTRRAASASAYFVLTGKRLR